MVFELYNADIEPIVVEQNHGTIMLQPCQATTIHSDHNEINIKLYNIKKDKFNTVWYLLNELFTLEQMRTVLVVEGEYIIRNSCNSSLLKIKNQEYIFDKNTSYQVFVFSTCGCSVQRKRLQIANRFKILKRARLLYLFGGEKTLFPLAGIALLASLIKMLFAPEIPGWFWLMVIALTLCFIWLFVKYIKSLRFLHKVTEEEYIFKYMSSERKQYRKLSDELIQKHLDANAGDDEYW